MTGALCPVSYSCTYVRVYISQTHDARCAALRHTLNGKQKPCGARCPLCMAIARLYHVGSLSSCCYEVLLEGRVAALY